MSFDAPEDPPEQALRQVAPGQLEPEVLRAGFGGWEEASSGRLAGNASARYRPSSWYINRDATTPAEAQSRGPNSFHDQSRLRSMTMVLLTYSARMCSTCSATAGSAAGRRGDAALSSRSVCSTACESSA